MGNEAKRLRLLSNVSRSETASIEKLWGSLEGWTRAGMLPSDEENKAKNETHMFGVSFE